MSALAQFEDVAVSGFWRIGCMLLACALLVTGGGLGFKWWEASHDRDLARADLAAERQKSALLTSAVDTQNEAVDALAAARKLAEAHGQAAQLQAAAAARRFDNALQALASAKATTCEDAMPAVNQLLKDIQ